MFPSTAFCTTIFDYYFYRKLEREPHCGHPWFMILLRLIFGNDNDRIHIPVSPLVYSTWRQSFRWERNTVDYLIWDGVDCNSYTLTHLPSEETQRVLSPRPAHFMACRVSMRRQHDAWNDLTSDHHSNDTAECETRDHYLILAIKIDGIPSFIHLRLTYQRCVCGNTALNHWMFNV